MALRTSEQSKRRSAWIGALAAGSLVLTATVVNLSQPEPAFSQSEAPETAVSFADVIENVSPAVVNIAVTKVMRPLPTAEVPRFGPSQDPGSLLEEWLERYFGFEGGPMLRGEPMPERRAEGQGSGFIIDAEGYIVTNNHVVEGAERILVTLQDGDQLEATLVGTDPKTDLALIRVDETGLPFVEFGDSSTARVGDWVVAIGNPFGLGGTATAGIISARGRDIRSGPYDDFLQIDAPINQGNSGGPVFNTRGEVIGVNTAIYSPNGGNIGIGFAIPSNQARNVISDLREDGVVERGWLGVSIQDLDEALAESLGLDPDTEGALVAQVLDGPAGRSGIQRGDLITRFNGEPIDSARALSTAVAEADPAQTVTVTVLRDGQSRDFQVELGRASTTEMAEASPRGPGFGRFQNQNAGSVVGLTLRPLTDEDKAQLGIAGDVTGALVTAVQPDSPAAEKGLRAGDVIVEVDGKPVASPDDALAALGEARASDGNALLLVQRGDAQRYVGLKFS